MGPTGVSGGIIFWVPPDDVHALQVIGEDCIRWMRTADDGGGLQMTGEDCR